MENYQSLATDSFSHSWLINRKPSAEIGLIESFRPSLDGSCESTFNEVMHAGHPNKFLKEDEDFDFNINPDIRSPGAADLVPADEIFFDGCIKPVYSTTRSNMQLQVSTSTPATPISSFPPITVCSAYRSQYYFLRKWSKSSNKVLQKCFAFLRPFVRRAGYSRKSIRVVDLDRKVWEVGSWSNSFQASPDLRTTYSDVNSGGADCAKQKTNKDYVYKKPRSVKSWNTSPLASPQRTPSHPTYARCDIESSIHEAILHCKRSFAQ